MNKIIIMGGGTISHVRNHLALCAPAYGQTARELRDLCTFRFKNMEVELVLTRMADPLSNMETNEDVARVVDVYKKDPDVKVIFFNVAMCDWTGQIAENVDEPKDPIPSGKYAERLHTSEGDKVMILLPKEKIIRSIRKDREDIFVVGFKTTCGAGMLEQVSRSADLLKEGNINMVLANDTRTRINIISRENQYDIYRSANRHDALRNLVWSVESKVCDK